VETAELSQRQQRILEVIRDAVKAHGYPPSVREIGDAVGLRSASSVHSQLAALERSGYLRIDRSRPRALALCGDDEPTVEAASHPAESAADVQPPAGAQPVGHGADAGTHQVPLVGEIAAGSPIVADEQVEQVMPLPEELVGKGTLFMVRVRGESMIDAGILPGDLVVVRQQPVVEQGELCAALIDGEATVKQFRRAPDGAVVLEPANEAYEPIPLEPEVDAEVLGKVTAVLRRV
jgi:repressor LexA